MVSLGADSIRNEWQYWAPDISDADLTTAHPSCKTSLFRALGDHGVGKCQGEAEH